jgi:hypothetical protein
MYTAHGYIRDYDPVADTATVELVGIGIIDTWIKGMRVHLSVTRGALAAGIPCTVEMPDPHRICEATIVNVYDQVTAYAQGASAQKVKTQRIQIALDAAGNGTINVTYPTPAFAAAPNLAVTCDGRVTPGLISAGVAGFSASVAVPSNPNGSVVCTYQAIGT